MTKHETSQDTGKELNKDPGRVGQFVRRLLAVGLDGKGPVQPAAEMGRRVRARSGSDKEAIRTIRRRSVFGGGIGGFATGVGGFVTMPVAIPVNVGEFYIQAVRMVGAIAAIRGYDLEDPQIRTSVLLTLVGSRADDVLKSVGISSPTGRLTNVAMKRLPPEALMLINKAIAMRLLKAVGERTLTKLGRGIPVAGGVIGGGFDMWMMKRIADQAVRSFPAVNS